MRDTVYIKDADGTELVKLHQIIRDGIPVANISKRWFRVRESYGVAAPGGRRRSWLAAQSSTSGVPGRPSQRYTVAGRLGAAASWCPPCRRAEPVATICSATEHITVAPTVWRELRLQDIAPSRAPVTCLTSVPAQRSAACSP